MTEMPAEFKKSTRIWRIGLIGLGGSADRILLPALRQLKEVQVVAGADVNPEVRAGAQKKWRIPKVYATATEMLETEEPDIAVVATPPHTHPELCLEALQSGCHVFCEKPFMPSLESAEEVISAARRLDRQIAVNNQYYQMKIYQETARRIASGEIGLPYHILVWQQMFQLPEQEGGWKAALQPRRVLFEFGTHAVDLLCFFFRAYPEAVTARILPKKADADTVISLRLDFPENRVATLYLNRASHAPKRYLEMRIDCDEASFRVSLGGVACLEAGWNSELARPRFRFSLTRGGEARLERQGRSVRIASQPRSELYKAAARHFRQFLRAIETGNRPAISAEHARNVLAAIFAAYESAEQGGVLVRCSVQAEAST